MSLHTRNDWPKLHWNSTNLAYPLADVRFLQGRFLGRMELLPPALRDEYISKIRVIELHSSSEIDGVKLEPDRLPSNGIAKLMSDATAHYAQPLTVERLFEWLSNLLPLPALKPNLRMFRVNTTPFAPAPHRLPREMDLFLHWFNKDGHLDAVLKTGVAFLWFLALQPFSDANGRIACAIANLRLARSEKTADRFYSLSHQIQLDRESYEQILAQTLQGDTDLTPWLQWFLQTLSAAISHSENLLSPILAKARLVDKLRDLDLNPRQRSMLNHLLDNPPLKLTSTSYAASTNTSHDTATRDIHDLIQKNLLQPSAARGRNTSYSLNLNLTDSVS